MDSRIILEPGTKLRFPGMECTIDSFVGKGSNAVVYLGSYPDEQFKSLRHRILIKELFPYDPKGQIFRDSEGNVCWKENAAPAMEMHKLSFRRGNEVHLKLLGEHPSDIDANINTFSLNQTLYTVLGFSGGRSLDKELNGEKSSGIPLNVHVRRIMGTLDVLEAFHNSGFLHMDISPDNILLIGEGKRERITLIDYNSVHTLREIRQRENVYYSAKEGFTAPEIRSGRTDSIGYPSDLYALTAVFYRSLTGRNLTVLQTVRGQVPDVSDAPCLAEVPDTVNSMVKKILKRGLMTLVSRRYQTAEEMRKDLEELQDRIEGKGITHPALWETGRANILRAVRSNPALNYIREDEKIYPILGETVREMAGQEEETLSLEELIKKMASPGGKSVFLLGSGGSGKTTALLRAAYLQPEKYSGTDPAFTYLSLYGWSEGKTSYIKDHILESLRFKPDTQNMEMARHELIRLLSTPMYTRLGERPKLVILLDGLNEITGDTKELIKEITELSAMPGVRILLTGRSDADEISFCRVRLRPLEKEEVRKILGENGILPPEEEAMSELLCSPMMLSIYVQTSLNQEKQLVIHSQEELLDSYFAAIAEKEIRGLPEDSKMRWQTEAALSFVLPEIAGLMNRKGRALSDQDMLPALEKCYRRMKKRMMMRVFPEWIGHISDIRGETENAEAWYGLMVHEFLWRRMGMLVKDEQGRYRTSHQLIEEYLIRVQRRFEKKFFRYERTGAFLITVLCIICMAAAYESIYLPYLVPKKEEVKIPYDESLAENVLDASFAAYIICADQYEYFSGLIDCIQEEPDDEYAYERALKSCQNSLKIEMTTGMTRAAGYLESLFGSGEVMPWSGQPLKEDAYRAMLALPEERAAEYEVYLDTLVQAREDQSLWDYFGEDYIKKLDDLLQADAYVLGKYYNQVIAPELSAMEQSDSEEVRQNYMLYMKSIAFAAGQDEITEEATKDINIYARLRNTALSELRKNGLMEIFRIEENGR